MKSLLEEILNKCYKYTKEGKAASYIPELAKADTNEFGIFLSYNQCILNIYGDEHVKNLKGAFLEVLSFKIFYNNC